MTEIDREHLLELEDIVFVRRQNTIENVASEYSRADLVDTINAARREIRDIVATLPAAAFEPQPPDADGEAIWSAGEIASHLLEMMFWLQLALQQLAGKDPGGSPDEQTELRVLDRPATLDVIRQAGRELERALEMADEAPRDTRIKIEGLGEPGVHGLLLLHAIHEWEHAEQFAALAWAL